MKEGIAMKRCVIIFKNLLISTNLMIPILLLICMLSMSCGNKGKKSETNINTEGVGFTARLGSDYAVYGYSNLKIVAVPVSGFSPLVKFEGETYTKSAAVNSDGSFSLQLQKQIIVGDPSIPEESMTFDIDYVILVVDKSSTEEKIISYISMDSFNVSKIGLGGLNSLETIIKIPVADSNSDIDAGELTLSNGNEALSTSSTGGDFNLTGEQLKIIARSDDVAKSVKNDYLNSDIETKVFYNWDDPSVAADFSDITDSYSDPLDLNFLGSSIYMYTQSWAPDKLGTFDDIVSRSTKLALYPPAGSTVTSLHNHTYNDTNPIANNGNMIAGPDEGEYYYNDFRVGSDERIECTFGLSELTTLPSGDWLLKKDDTTIGIYDFAVGNPFYGSTSVIKVYIPSVKLTISAGKLARIDLKYYLYDGTNYVEVTDYSMMKKDGYQLGIGINTSDNNLQSLDDQPVEKVSFTEDDFGAVNAADLTYICASLNTGPFCYEYVWRKN